MEASHPSPLDAYAEWFGRLPPELARELLAALRLMVPPSVLPPVDSSDRLAERLRAHATNDHLAAGTALVVGALTDFVFLSRGTEQSWEENEALLDLLKEAHELASEGAVNEDLVDFIEESRMRQPFRSRMWMKEQAGWRALRGGILSPEEIGRWLKSRMLALPS